MEKTFGTVSSKDEGKLDEGGSANIPSLKSCLAQRPRAFVEVTLASLPIVFEECNLLSSQPKELSAFGFCLLGKSRSETSARNRALDCNQLEILDGGMAQAIAANSQMI